MSVKARLWIERQFVTLTVKALLKAGKKLSIDRSEEDRGSVPINDTSAATIDEIVACDMETLFVAPNAWVQFVYGNDGWDVISDYTTSLESVMAPILQIGMDEDMDALIAAIAAE